MQAPTLTWRHLGSIFILPLIGLAAGYAPSYQPLLCALLLYHHRHRNDLVLPLCKLALFVLWIQLVNLHLSSIVLPPRHMEALDCALLVIGGSLLELLELVWRGEVGWPELETRPRMFADQNHNRNLRQERPVWGRGVCKRFMSFWMVKLPLRIDLFAFLVGLFVEAGMCGLTLQGPARGLRGQKELERVRRGEVVALGLEVPPEAPKGENESESHRHEKPKTGLGAVRWFMFSTMVEAPVLITFSAYLSSFNCACVDLGRHHWPLVFMDIGFDCGPAMPWQGSQIIACFLLWVSALWSTIMFDALLVLVDLPDKYAWNWYVWSRYDISRGGWNVSMTGS